MNAADLDDDVLLEELSRRSPRATVEIDFALRAVAAARRRRRQLEPPPGGYHTLAQLAPLFPNGRGEPRSVRALALDCEKGRFGEPGSPDGPKKEGTRWKVPHAAALAALGANESPAAPPAEKVEGVHPLRPRAAGRGGGPLSEALRAADP
jgi:hypothetical protein